MEAKEKDNMKRKFAACLMKIINANKLQAKANAEKGIENLDLVTSLRKLAAASGVDYATIQKIATGKKNPAWTTTVLIAEGLGLSMEEWGRKYDEVSL